MTTATTDPYWCLFQVFPDRDTEVLGYYDTEQQANEAYKQFNQQNPIGFYETCSLPVTD